MNVQRELLTTWPSKHHQSEVITWHQMVAELEVGSWWLAIRSILVPVPSMAYVVSRLGNIVG